MSKSIVYQISQSNYIKNPQILDKTLDKFKDILKGKTAIKTHFGEPGNENAFRGQTLKPAIDWTINNQLDAFLTDANTLYVGFRSNSKNHLETAIKHGFDKLGVPIQIAEDNDKVITLTELKNHYNKLPVRLGNKLLEADSILCLSHFKGHSMFGFGGALKNLGMGSATPKGKKILHSDVSPKNDPDKCILCGACVANCPAQAISIVNNKIVIDYGKCIGCGECITVCSQKAMETSSTNSTICQEKTAVYAYGLVKNKPLLCVNYLININPVCDCAGTTKPIIFHDLGILISTDPVALDQASLDWLDKESGKKLLLEVNGVDYEPILKMGEEIGLGSRKYELKEVLL